MTSMYKRAPLPRSHREHWANHELDGQESPRPTCASVQAALIRVLQDISSHYNKPGYPAPPSPKVERLCLREMLQKQLQETVSTNSISHIVGIVALALFNQVSLPWDADRFAEQAKNTIEKEDFISPSNVSLFKFFEMVNLGSFSEPTVIVDCHGRILIWYLPGIVEKINDLNNATTHLNKELRKSVQVPTEKKKHAKWRVHVENFIWRGGEHKYEPGSLDFSPCWFEANHEVHKPLPPHTQLHGKKVNLIFGQRLQDHMVESLSLHRPCVTSWLNGITDVERDLNLVFSLIAPELHTTGANAIKQLQEAEDVHTNVTAWPSVFSGIGVISDRKTLMHRDQGGWPACYDLLVAGGHYDEAWLDVPDIGAKFRYQPGTAVAVCGKLLRHGVQHSIGGQMLCYAHYMRNNVLNQMSIPQSSWVTFRSYTKYMSTSFLTRQNDWSVLVK